LRRGSGGVSGAHRWSGGFPLLQRRERDRVRRFDGYGCGTLLSLALSSHVEERGPLGGGEGTR
jgi:hypothetical protein